MKLDNIFVRSRETRALDVIWEVLNWRLRTLLVRVASVHLSISLARIGQVRVFACYFWWPASPRWCGGGVLGELSRRYLFFRKIREFPALIDKKESNYRRQRRQVQTHHRDRPGHRNSPANKKEKQSNYSRLGGTTIEAKCLAPATHHSLASSLISWISLVIDDHWKFCCSFHNKSSRSPRLPTI
jgi:hypothetical protein